MKKLLCSILAACMLSTLVPGCSSDKGAASAGANPGEKLTKEQITEKEVNLTMHLIGAKQDGADEVFAKLNEMTKRDLNATVTVNFMSWGDWKTKYPLVLASGENVDLIFAANWAFYDEQVRKGGFAPLDGLLKDYAPELYKSIPEEGWKQATVDDQIYMVPCNRNEYDCVAFMYRKDLGDKYGAPEIKDWATFEQYCEAIKANESGMLPFNAGEGDLKLMELTYTGMEKDVYIPVHVEDTNAFVKLDDYKDPNFKLRIDEFDSGFPDFLKMMRRFQEKGFWSKSVLGNEIGSLDAFENGTSAIGLCNLENGNNYYKKLIKNFPDAEVGFYNVYGDRDRSISLPLISNGTAIVRTSQNKERAIMLMELLHTNKEYNYLTIYGLEGRDYTIKSDGSMGPGEEKGKAGGIGSAWGWTVSAIELKDSESMPLYDTLKEEYSKKVVYNPMISFFPMLDSVQAEYSAYTNVMKQYKTPLVWGLIPDVDAGYQELVTKLKEAGYETYLAEVEKQFKEYAAKQE